LRNGATYGPWLRVPNPDGGVAQPLKTIPPSGHLAGVISRLDRERGAHHTPANVSLLNAIDVETRLKPDEEEMLNGAGLNLIRCQPGRGLMVWGGRSLDPDDGARFIAHRRLIHRLVRAIRRVAEPIVFDGNTPALWLAFTRAITTVLLAAFRAGALQGERPDEAFKVECNEKTNPQSEQDLGRVICLISVAPAVPMEYITLRVALSENQEVEVFDA
jgi:phage tail sheath protein FI